MCSAICRNKIQPTEEDPWSGEKNEAILAHAGWQTQVVWLFVPFLWTGSKKKRKEWTCERTCFFFIRGCFDDYDVGFLYWSAFFRVSPWGHTGRPMSGRFVSFFDFFSSPFPPIACRKCHPIISISNTLSESKIKLKLPVIIHSVRITIN